MVVSLVFLMLFVLIPGTNAPLLLFVIRLINVFTLDLDWHKPPFRWIMAFPSLEKKLNHAPSNPIKAFLPSSMPETSRFSDQHPEVVFLP